MCNKFMSLLKAAVRRRTKKYDVKDPLTAFEKIQKEITKNALKLGECSDDLGDFLDRLKPFLKNLKDVIEGMPVQDLEYTVPVFDGKEWQEILRNQASLGVNTLHIVDDEGSAYILSDFFDKILLPPKVAELFKILSEDTGEIRDKKDEKVGWKSKEIIAKELTARTGETCKPGAIANLIHRLREKLKGERANPFLVQQNAKWGYRFAVKKTGAYKPEEN